MEEQTADGSPDVVMPTTTVSAARPSLGVDSLPSLIGKQYSLGNRLADDYQAAAPELEAADRGEQESLLRQAQYQPDYSGIQKIPPPPEVRKSVQDASGQLLAVSALLGLATRRPFAAAAGALNEAGAARQANDDAAYEKAVEKYKLEITQIKANNEIESKKIDQSIKQIQANPKIWKAIHDARTRELTDHTAPTDHRLATAQDAIKSLQALKSSMDKAQAAAEAADYHIRSNDLRERELDRRKEADALKEQVRQEKLRRMMEGSPQLETAKVFNLPSVEDVNLPADDALTVNKLADAYTTTLRIRDYVANNQETLTKISRAMANADGSVANWLGAHQKDKDAEVSTFSKDMLSVIGAGASVVSGNRGITVFADKKASVAIEDGSMTPQGLNMVLNSFAYDASQKMRQYGPQFDSSRIAPPLSLEAIHRGEGLPPVQNPRHVPFQAPTDRALEGLTVDQVRALPAGTRYVNPNDGITYIKH